MIMIVNRPSLTLKASAVSR